MINRASALHLVFDNTYVYITVKYNNINILSSQVNFDVQVNIESFDLAEDLGICAEVSHSQIGVKNADVRRIISCFRSGVLNPSDGGIS